MNNAVQNLILRALRIGAGESMRLDEIKKNRKVIFPGDEVWFPKDDWINDVVVSITADQTTVRIIAIIAKKPGNGSFSRLIDGIFDAHMTPVVIEAMGVMPAIMRRWGWNNIQVGSGWESENQWRPSRKFRRSRFKAIFSEATP